MAVPYTVPLRPRSGAGPTLQGLADLFQMLADPSRLKILLALSHEGELHVTALCQRVGQSQPAVSHHLSLLRARKLVAVRREGKNNYYRVDQRLLSKPLESMLAALASGQQTLRDGRP